MDPATIDDAAHAAHSAHARASRPARRRTRRWADAPARALPALLDWVEASGDPMVALDRDGAVAIANAAFARVFATATAGGAPRVPLARHVPLLTAARLARWASEAGTRGAPAPRVHRLLAEALGADGDRFLVAVTLVGAGGGADDDAPACLVALRPVDAPRGACAPDAAGSARPRDTVAIGALLDAALRALPSPQARRRCRLRPHAADALVAADPEPIRDALGRVLDNACRYSPPATPVLVRTRVEPADAADGPGAAPRVVVTVADRGRGLSRAHAQRAFEPFWRAPEAADEPGQGLGLAIARHLVDGQGGWIELRSVPGVGTEVELWLPAAPPGAGA